MSCSAFVGVSTFILWMPKRCTTLSSGSLRAGVSTGESGQTLPVWLDWLDFPDVFTTGDGQHILLEGTQAPDRYEQVSPVVPASNAFELELRDEASIANTQPFLVLRDATAPEMTQAAINSKEKTTPANFFKFITASVIGW